MNSSRSPFGNEVEVHGAEDLADLHRRALHLPELLDELVGEIERATLIGGGRLLLRAHAVQRARRRPLDALAAHERAEPGGAGEAALGDLGGLLVVGHEGVREDGRLGVRARAGAGITVPPAPGASRPSRYGVPRGRPAARRRRAVAAVPGVLRAPQEHQGRGRTARERAARHREPPAPGRRRARPARGRPVLRRRGRRLPGRGVPGLPRRPPRDAARTRAPVDRRACVLRRVRVDVARSGVRRLEADDLLGALARVETEAGGQTLLFTGDRDMFQCVGDRVRVLFPAKGGPDEIGPARGARALRHRPRAGAGPHRAARRPVRRPAGGEGHRREGRRRPADALRDARGRAHRSGRPR